MKNADKILFLFAIIWLAAGIPLTAQTVNIESARHKTDTTGYSGGINLGGSFLDNGNKIYTINVVPDIQYKSEKSLYLLLGDYKMTRSDDIAFRDAAFLHFRYNYKLSKLVRWEAFTQIQYNKIMLLEYRFLLGTGPRFRLYRDDHFRFYFGFTPMYEYEQLTDPGQSVNKFLRLSQYLSFTISLGDHASLYSTTYYQPVLRNWDNYRFHSDQKLKVYLKKNLSLTMAALYSWDNYAPEGAPPRVMDLTVGCEFEF